MYPAAEARYRRALEPGCNYPKPLPFPRSSNEKEPYGLFHCSPLVRPEPPRAAACNCAVLVAAPLAPALVFNCTIMLCAKGRSLRGTQQSRERLILRASDRRDNCTFLTLRFIRITGFMRPSSIAGGGRKAERERILTEPLNIPGLSRLFIYQVKAVGPGMCNFFTFFLGRARKKVPPPT